MSLYCPECWAKAKCYDSRCRELTNIVWRRHECTECGHRFTTLELIPGDIDLRAAGNSTLVKLAWEIFDRLGGEKAECEIVAAWAERQEAAKIKHRRAVAEHKARNREDKPAKRRRVADDHPWRKHLPM